MEFVKTNQVIATGPAVPNPKVFAIHRHVVIQDDYNNFSTAIESLNPNGKHIDFENVQTHPTLKDALDTFATHITTNVPETDTIQPKTKTSPKEVAYVGTHNGLQTIVARTYDENHIPRPGKYSLVFEGGNFDAPSHTIYKNSYTTIQQLVHRYYPDAKWAPHDQF